MAKNIRERKRKVELRDLSSDDQAEQIGESLGKKIAEIGDKAAKEISALTEIYGIKAIIAVQLIDHKTGQILN